MLMLTLLLCAGYACIIWLPRLLVATLVLLIVFRLSRRAAKTTVLLLQNRQTDLDYDRKPTRAQRRQIRASLQLALHQTELRSLFPGLMARVDGRAR